MLACEVTVEKTNRFQSAPRFRFASMPRTAPATQRLSFQIERFQKTIHETSPNLGGVEVRLMNTTKQSTLT